VQQVDSRQQPKNKHLTVLFRGFSAALIL